MCKQKSPKIREMKSGRVRQHKKTPQEDGGLRMQPSPEVYVGMKGW
jgi:hypothetical protein